MQYIVHFSALKDVRRCDTIQHHVVYAVKKRPRVSVSFVKRRKKVTRKTVEFAEANAFTTHQDRFRIYLNRLPNIIIVVF